MPIISIVVPVYNVEKYLERCVESIRNQSLNDIEIILVDDGSSDLCPQLCDKYALEDDRIRVVHKKNGGLSSARNAGMKIARGKYIGFVDSDDSVLPTMYEEMLQVIQKEDVDFVMSDYNRILRSGNSFLKTLSIPAGFYNKKKIVDKIYPSLIMSGNIDYGPLLSVWHCLYKLQFLRNNQISFDEDVRWSEDNIFSAIVGYCANSFYYLKGRALYNYYQNEGTITTTYRKGAWNVYCTMNKHLREYFSQTKGYDFGMQLNFHLIYYACNCIGQALGLLNVERIREIKNILYSSELCKAFNDIKLSDINVPIKLKIQLFLMKKKKYRILNVLLSRRR